MSPGRAVLPILALLAGLPGEAPGQRRVLAPSGESLSFPEEELRRMLEETRALRRDLEEDPRILYFTGTGPGVAADEPADAYPWNAVDVLADSVATIRTPGNLREADRAYANYAVLRMRHVRMDPDVRCDSIFAREVRAVSGFVDGWIVARTLFGGPAFPPLDELVFAREAGALSGLVAARGNRQLGGCLRVWSEAHPEAIERYRTWREERFAGGTNAPSQPIEAGTNGSRAGRPRDRSGHPRAPHRRRGARPTPGPTPHAWVSASTTR